jgi:hypothetical protein
MPTPARGPQTTPPDEGRSSRLPAPRTPRHRSFTCSTTYDGRALGNAQSSIAHLRFSPTTLPRPSRPKGASRRPQPCSALLHERRSPGRRLGASGSRPHLVVAAGSRTWASVGSHGTSPATSVARPSDVLPRSTSDARLRLCQLRWMPCRCRNPAALGYRAPTDNHATAGYRAAAGYHAASDTVPLHGVGYDGQHAACSVQFTTCNVMNTRDEQHATKIRAHDIRDEITSRYVRGVRLCQSC